MELRRYGRSGLRVSALGFGAMEMGDPQLAEADSERLLHAVLDSGINLIDTARAYGLSEERIGRYLAGRRQDVVLSTKVGYGVDGVPDWTSECVAAGVDAALARLRTDRLDIVHLHSCPAQVLAANGVIEALVRAREQGKIIAAAYSGENDDLDHALASAGLDGFQLSVNVFDQRGLARQVPRAVERGSGVLAKRPLANAPWRFAERPAGHYAEAYWLRWQAVRGELDFDGDWHELALRFALAAPGVSSAIVGTTRIEHLARNVAVAERGALTPARYEAVRAAFDRVSPGWGGEL